MRRTKKDIDLDDFIHLFIIQMIIFFVALCFYSCQAMKERTSISSEVSEPLTSKAIVGGNKSLTYREMNDFLSGLMEEYNIIALSVAVTVKRQTFLFCMGYMNSKSKKPINNNTIFQAGPLGQPVFASLVIELWLEGIIDLDQPIYKYLKKPLPEYPDYRDLKDDSRYKRLTSRMILSHQSGLPYSRSITPEKKLNFIFSPGKHFGYSTEGYQLLQFVIEEITGKSINDLAKEKIFDPLSMRRSSFLWEPRFEGNIILSRTVSNPSVHLFQEKASVSDFFLTTVSDYAKYFSTRPSGEWPEVSITSKSIYSPPKTDNGFFKPKRFSWNLGWGYYFHRGNHVTFHGGREKGYENYASAFYSHKGAASIVILSVPSNKKTFTAKILEVMLGEISAPLNWLDFEQKYHD